MNLSFDYSISQTLKQQNNKDIASEHYIFVEENSR